MNTHHLVLRLICAPFVYTINFFKAARVPVTKKKAAFYERRQSAAKGSARRLSMVEERADRAV